MKPSLKTWAQNLATASIVSALVIFFSTAVYGRAAEPAVANLAFVVPPERKVEFKTAFRTKIVPVLKQHGIVPSSRKRRATVDSVFSQLFEFKTPTEFVAKRETLQADEAWKDILKSLGETFGQTDETGLLPHRFEFYETPAGSGKTVPAGPGKGHWRTCGVDDGLSNGVVFCMLQDRKGILWFGTQGGVIRFDGQSWTTFTTTDGLANNQVFSIFEDRAGNLWFGTQGGATQFDGHTWTTFTTENGLAHNSVTSIIQDRKGDLWFGTLSGATRYDGKTWATLKMRGGQADTTVWTVCEDAEGNFWFGTSNGVFRYSGVTQPGDSTAWIHYTTEDGLGHNHVESILQDRKKNLWFGTLNGATRFDGKTWTTFKETDGLAANEVTSIFQDRSGNLWFGSGNRWYGGAGVSRYDGRTWTVFTQNDGLGSDRVLPILEDLEGHLWFGSVDLGVSRYDGETWRIFTKEDGLPQERVTSFREDRKGNLWFTVYPKGTCRYDERNFTLYTSGDGLDSPFFTLLEDRHGNLWFAVPGGLCRYDEKSFVYFTPEDGLADGFVRAGVEDRAGNLWFGTFGGGVSRFDGKTWTTFTTENGLANNRINVGDALQDQDGNLWFGTYGGASRYDGKTWTTFTTENGLVNNVVRAIFQDRDGNLWFGTSGGVSRFDGKLWTNFTIENGLAAPYVETIFQDIAGHLWFMTAGGGVSRYDGKTWTVLTQKDGLASNSLLWGLQDRKGNFWFGGRKGLNRYRPSKSSPPIVFIDAVVADRRRESAAELTFSSTVGLTAFEFHAVSFKTRPEAMVYRYRLAGHEDTWKTTHGRRVEYQNLPAGTYRFEVEAVDRDLVYSETPATVALNVHPPYGTIGLWSALGLTLALVGWQTARVIRRDRRLLSANRSLQDEIAEREQAEAERAKLDAQLQHLRYLYHLRSALTDARSPDAVYQETGRALMNVLSPTTSAGVRIEQNGHTWTFGNTDNNGQNRYERPIAWGGKERARMVLFASLRLSETQERALLDETAGQIARVLEARELEMQLLQSGRLVALGQMSAGVAHELHQPLGAISATAEDVYMRLVEGLKLPPDQLQDMMQDILGLVERMAGTVDRLRVFSRDALAEPGIRFCLNEPIHAALKLIGTQLKNHDILLRLDLAEDLPHVMGHPHRIEQVFLNLLSNARDALNALEERNNAEPREKHLTVRTRSTTENGTVRVVAEVEDNGIGMDASDQAHIFEPFFTTKEVGKGTGLGLSISYAIVKDHAGEITYQSRTGEGTVFRVLLSAPPP